MRFVPNYCVSYHGEFHNAGCAFEIDREDAEEMSRHGTVAEDAPADVKNPPATGENAPAAAEDTHMPEGDEPAVAEACMDTAESGVEESKPEPEETTPARKPGRPKKNDTE